MSNLANAYKISECNSDLRYALYYMNALLMDKPDPGESLLSNIVWSFSNENIRLSVDESSINSFLLNNYFEENHLLKGKEGSFLNYIEKQLPLIRKLVGLLLRMFKSPNQTLFQLFQI